MALADLNSRGTPLDVSDLKTMLTEVYQVQSLKSVLPTLSNAASPTLQGIPPEVRHQIFLRVLPPLYSYTGPRRGFCGFPIKIALVCRLFHSEVHHVLKEAMAIWVFSWYNENFTNMRWREKAFFAKYAPCVKKLNWFRTKLITLADISRFPNLKACRVNHIYGKYGNVDVKGVDFPRIIDKPNAKDFFDLLDRGHPTQGGFDYKGTMRLIAEAKAKGKPLDVMVNLGFCVRGRGAWRLFVNLTKKTFIDCVYWCEDGWWTYHLTDKTRGKVEKSLKWTKCYSNGWSPLTAPGNRWNTPSHFDESLVQRLEKLLQQYKDRREALKNVR